MVDRIAGMYTATFQFSPCGDVPYLEPTQPPMNEILYATLVFSPFVQQDQSRPELQGKKAKYVSDHWYGFLSMMQTAATLLNESLQWARPMDATPEVTFQKTLPWERIRLAAIAMATHAVMAPVLAAYRDVRQENPAVSIRSLDAVVDDEARLSALHELRKEVFHVIEPNLTSDRADPNDFLGDAESSMGYRLAEGLPKFLSWLIPPQRPAERE